MNRDSIQFWSAIAVILFAAATFKTELELTASLDLGSVGQWVAAMLTVGAVWAAIRNTNRTLLETERREIAKQRREAEAYLAAVQRLFGTCRAAINSLHDEEEQYVSVVKAMMEYTHLDGFIGVIDRIPLHSAPRADVVDAIIGLRVAVVGAVKDCNEAVAGKDDLEKINVDLSADLRLLEEAKALLPTRI